MADRPGTCGNLPPGAQDQARANASLARNLDGYVEEFVEANTAMQQAAALTTLAGEPRIVLTADTRNDPGWEQEQYHMAGLSPNNVHWVAHDSMISNQAAAASSAIPHVVEAVPIA